MASKIIHSVSLKNALLVMSVTFLSLGSYYLYQKITHPLSEVASVSFPALQGKFLDNFADIQVAGAVVNPTYQDIASDVHISGLVQLNPTSAPSPTTDKLYNVGGSLFWNGMNLSSGGLWTASGTNIYNSNSGNVGIGTTNPQGKLHVAGTTHIVGDLVADCDGSTTSGVGTCGAIVEGQALVPVVASDRICTEFAGYPYYLRIDPDGNCASATDGTYLRGSTANPATVLVTSNLSYVDSNGSGTYNNGEDLYVDFNPVGTYSQGYLGLGVANEWFDTGAEDKLHIYDGALRIDGGQTQNSWDGWDAEIKSWGDIVIRPNSDGGGTDRNVVIGRDGTGAWANLCVGGECRSGWGISSCRICFRSNDGSGNSSTQCTAFVGKGQESWSPTTWHNVDNAAVYIQCQ